MSFRMLMTAKALRHSGLVNDFNILQLDVTGHGTGKWTGKGWLFFKSYIWVNPFLPLFVFLRFSEADHV